MKIALHLGTLRGHGSAAVGRNILTELISQGQEHEFLVWVPSEWSMTYGIGPDSFGPNVTVRQTRPGLLQKMATENIQMRLAMRRFGTQRLFSLGDTSLPGCPVPHLLLVQQAHLYLRPRDRDFPVPKSFELKIGAMTAYFRAALKTLDKITVQSQTMRQGLIERYGIDEARIVVIPSAIRGFPQLLKGPVKGERKRLTLCYVASGSPHKNHDLLADVLHGLSGSYPELRLRLTVSQGSVPSLVNRASDLKVLDRIDFMGSMPFDEVLKMMKSSTIAVMPSKLESFGFPYYEAMALGLPLVAADKPFAREACADGALYADANDPDPWIAAIENLLSTKTARTNLGKKGLARFREVEIGWDEVARRYLITLEQLVRG